MSDSSVFTLLKVRDLFFQWTPVDWQVFYNDHLENLDRSYGMKGEVYRNYIQIPKEVNMPTEIKRLKYTAVRRLQGGQLNPVFARETEYMSKYVTFDNPEPAEVDRVPLTDGVQTFSRDSWNSYTRGYDTLHNNTSFYFKDAEKVPETKAIIDANALEGNRVIWDQSNTGGNMRDGFVWEFTTTVPDGTTNEQLKNMKAVMGMLRTGTAGVDHGVHTFAANPVNLSKADVSPEPTAKDQTVKVGQKPDAKKSIGNFDTLPQGTTAAYTTTVDTSNPGTVRPTVRVTYPDTSTKEVPVNVIVENETVAAPVVNTNANARNTVLSTDEELTGTGTPGATIKVTVKNPEGTTVISEKTTQVGADGNWKLPLDKGLNSNEVLGGNAASNAFYAPKNKVEVTQVVNGVSSAATEVTVSEGASTILPSAAAKDGKSVVAGAKEVTVTIPHDAGIAYFWYTNKNDNSKPQIDIKREADGNFVISGNNAGKATVKNVVKGNFSDTVTLTLTEPVKEGANLEIIPHNGLATKGTYLGRANIPVTNEKPVVSSATDSDVTTVTAGGTVNLSTLAKVTDHEDDQNATLGTKGTPRVVSINGDTSKTTLEAADLATPGTYTVKYKAVDSQGKESDEYTHTVTVQDTTAPAKPVVETDLTGKAGTKDPVVVDAEPGSTVKLLDKDGNELGKAVAGDNGKATITPTKDIPAGNVTATATDPAGNVSEASEPKEATPAKDTTAPAKPVVTTDLTGKAGTKDPVEVTAEPGSKVELFDKDGNKVGEGVANDKGVATITPTKELPEGGVTAKATDPAGNVSEASELKEATPVTPVTPVTPAKTEVKDPEHLTDKEKEAVKDKVEKANPGKNVTVDDKGNATVTDPTTGSSATIPSSDLVEKAKETPVTPVKPVTPAKTEVKDPAHLTDKEKEAVKDKVEKANPGKNVTVDDQGNATVTDSTTGSSETIPSSDLVEKAKEETPVTPVKPVTPAKTEVKDPANLTDKEKEAVKDKVEKANPGKNVTVDDQGNATVTDPTTGSSETIPSSDLVEKAKEETPVKPVTPAKTEVKAPSATSVKDPSNLTDAEKAKVAEEVKKSNPTATDVKVGKDGTTTVTFPDGSTAVIPAAKAVAKANDSEGVKDPSATAVKDPSNLTNADKAKAASNTSQATSSQANARKVAKELPNTGTADSTVAMVAAAASALLGLAGRRRKEDEEA